MRMVILIDLLLLSYTSHSRLHGFMGNGVWVPGRAVSGLLDESSAWTGVNIFRSDSIRKFTGLTVTVSSSTLKKLFREPPEIKHQCFDCTQNEVEGVVVDVELPEIEGELLRQSPPAACMTQRAAGQLHVSRRHGNSPSRNVQVATRRSQPTP